MMVGALRGWSFAHRTSSSILTHVCRSESNLDQHCKYIARSSVVLSKLLSFTKGEKDHMAMTALRTIQSLGMQGTITVHDR